MNAFIVMVDESYVDGTSYLTRPDGEWGSDGWVESDAKSLVLGTYNAPSAKEAIEEAAEQYEVSIEVLYAYQLVNHTAHSFSEE